MLAWLVLRRQGTQARPLGPSVLLPDAASHPSLQITSSTYSIDANAVPHNNQLGRNAGVKHAGIGLFVIRFALGPALRRMGPSRYRKPRARGSVVASKFLTMRILALIALIAGVVAAQ